MQTSFVVRSSIALLGLTLVSCAAAGAPETEQCPIGSEKCPCTDGGSCDAGLQCLSELCVEGESGSGGGGATTATTTGSTGMGGGFGAGGGSSCNAGCNRVDVLFALDGSGSMTEEINALAASQAFTSVIDAISAINCGGIEYRIGVTHDNDGGFLVPGGWAGPKPWFDSATMDDAAIAQAFTGAASSVVAGSGTATGCEHVLSSSVDLLESDATGFVRSDALLVLIFVTDVDDYGAYDNVSGNSCGLGCTVSGAPVSSLFDRLKTLKGGDASALATIVVAGDPSVNGGMNFCSQPGVCGCNGVDCAVFPATRLWEFAAAHPGTNGVTSNLCAGAQSVPTAVKSAFEGGIDLACQQYVPK